MSVALGKRKRSAPARPRAPAASTDARTSSQTPDDEGVAEAARAAFARAFEANFAPLEGITSQSNAYSDSASAASSASDFSGFGSDTDDRDNGAATVQVVTHSEAARVPSHLTKAQQKAFMTSKAPTSSSSSLSSHRKPSAAKDDKDDGEDEASAEALNVHNDLALQRLISESHLLDPARQPARNQRQRVADLRLQALGSRDGILGQRSMPMAFRKGIAAKKRQREDERRRDARENGIVLEKRQLEQTKSQQKESKRRRERGVGAPTVGRFKGGTLQLSRQDVQAIKGPGGRGGRGGTKGSRGRGKRR